MYTIKSQKCINLKKYKNFPKRVRFVYDTVCIQSQDLTIKEKRKKNYNKSECKLQTAFEILHLGKIKNGFDRIFSFLKYRKYIQCIFVLFYIKLLTFLQCCIKSVQMFLHTITPIYTTNSFLFRCLFYARDFCKYLQILANLVEPKNPLAFEYVK